MTELFVLMLTAVLVENFIFSKFMGCCPFLGVSEKPSTALGMGCAVMFVMTLSSAATWAVYHYILIPNELEYLKTIAFILLIAALVQFIEIVLKKFIPSLHKSLGVYLPLITTNCAVLGVAQKNVELTYGFTESMVNALGWGLGFMLAMVLFVGVRSRIDDSVISRSFKGIPATLIAASIVSLAFCGFAGVAESLFA